jgi:imidazole glycerol phosphate synthase glutamine amidotransferase subunit
MTAPAIQVGVVDYGAGNLVSIEQALLVIGATPRIVRRAEDLSDVDALVVPGVGAAGPAMRRLTKARLVDPIVGWIAAGRPYLGVCLGLQLLFDGSDEDGSETFGVLAGRTVRLENAPTLPHIGWNQVERSAEHRLFEAIPDRADFYFVHSYATVPAPADARSDDIAMARTTHGGQFISAIGRGLLFGVQFHPERSGPDGLQLLRNFVGLASGEEPAPWKLAPREIAAATA